MIIFKKISASMILFHLFLSALICHGLNKGKVEEQTTEKEEGREKKVEEGAIVLTATVGCHVL